MALRPKANERLGRNNSLGAFADASHFARVCRTLTGHPPRYWRPLLQAFY